MATLVALLILLSTPAAASAAAPAAPLVELPRYGRLRGAAQTNRAGPFWAFRGIPFAAPPVGPFRFAPPRPAAPWRPRTLDATKFGHSCMQDTSGSVTELPAMISEDCLFVNVFSPPLNATAASRRGGGLPVMVGVQTPRSTFWDIHAPHTVESFALQVG